MVEESIGERECKKFVEGLNSYNKTSSKEIHFKKYSLRNTCMVYMMQELACCLSFGQGFMG